MGCAVSYCQYCAVKYKIKIREEYCKENLDVLFFLHFVIPFWDISMEKGNMDPVCSLCQLAYLCSHFNETAMLQMLQRLAVVL